MRSSGKDCPGPAQVIFFVLQHSFCQHCGPPLKPLILCPDSTLPCSSVWLRLIRSSANQGPCNSLRTSGSLPFGTGARGNFKTSNACFILCLHIGQLPMERTNQGSSSTVLSTFKISLDGRDPRIICTWHAQQIHNKAVETGPGFMPPWTYDGFGWIWQLNSHCLYTFAWIAPRLSQRGAPSWVHSFLAGTLEQCQQSVMVESK